MDGESHYSALFGFNEEVYSDIRNHATRTGYHKVDPKETASGALVEVLEEEKSRTESYKLDAWGDTITITVTDSPRSFFADEEYECIVKVNLYDRGNGGEFKYDKFAGENGFLSEELNGERLESSPEN